MVPVVGLAAVSSPFLASKLVKNPQQQQQQQLLQPCGRAGVRAAHEGFHLMAGVWLRPFRSLKVKTEENVKLEPRVLPDPPCVVCKGHGRVKCHRCAGRGRLNFQEQAMLPKGEWPHWCWDCRGCGMSFCALCLGTGEKRGVIGFHFPDVNAAANDDDHDHDGDQSSNGISDGTQN